MHVLSPTVEASLLLERGGYQDVHCLISCGICICTDLLGVRERRRGGKVEKWRGGEVERWRGGEVERRRGGEAERWRGGEVERWRGGEVEGKKNERKITLRIRGCLRRPPTCLHHLLLGVSNVVATTERTNRSSFLRARQQAN